MRVGMQTWGTEGDVRPFFALGHALSARGHEVELVYTSVEGRDFGALAASCRVRATDVGSAYFREHREELAPRARESFALRNPLAQVRRILADLMDPVADTMLEAGEALAARSDVMVNHFIAYPAHTAAEKHGRPVALLAFVPIFPTADHAPIGMPAWGRLLNPLAWRLMARVMESVLADRVNRLRTRVGLPSVRGVHMAALERASLGLVAVSPALIARPQDWSARAQLSGFLALPDVAQTWEPDEALRSFLEAGPPPVFLSFGSMFNIDEDQTRRVTEVLAKAVALAGVRGIIQAPASTIRDAPRKGDILYIERAPHAHLFPRCSLVVHHGGAGTTQSTLLAGRPSIVVPHAADQFYWGDLLHRRGVASKPLRSTKLEARALAERIRLVGSRPEMTARATALGQALAKEDGPRRAAELVEAMT